MVDLVGQTVATTVRGTTAELAGWTDDAAVAVATRGARVLRVGVATSAVAVQPPLEGALSIGWPLGDPPVAL